MLIWLENVTLKFQFLKLKLQFLKTQLGNYYSQISHKNNSNLYSAHTPLSFKFEKHPMEVETLVCLETSQWKMNLRHMKRNRWETTHLKQESHTVFKTMQSALKVITFWNVIFFLNVELTYVCSELHMKVNIVQKSPRLECTDSLEDTAPKRPLVSPSRPASTPNFYGLSANRYYSKFWSLK